MCAKPYPTLAELSPELFHKFMSNVAVAGLDDCWPWTAGRDGKGYGCFWSGDRRLISSRLAYVVGYGSVPTDLMVCHRCDNPPCCNPSHLFLGTNRDNMRDKAAKGRCNIPSGRDSHHAVFTERDAVKAIAIRQQGVTIREIARRMGVSKSTAHRMVTQYTYRPIEEPTRS
jgi:hypothetical protein